MANIIPFSGNAPGLSDASLHVIRDMILLALDATEAKFVTEQNRVEARAALAEALDVMDGEGAQ